MVDQEPENSNKPTRASLTVRVCVIRDSTPGISLSMGDKLIGEWTDSRAKTLRLTDDSKVSICRAGGNQLYLFSVPGKPLEGEQVSDTEVTITFEM